MTKETRDSQAPVCDRRPAQRGISQPERTAVLRLLRTELAGTVTIPVDQVYAPHLDEVISASPGTMHRCGEEWRLE